MHKYVILILVLYIIYQCLYDQIESFYQSDPVLDQIKKQLSILHPKFKNVDIYEGDKSYTINKKKIYICLKDKDGKYYNKNMLVYVILHEYAHYLNSTIGHNNDFFQIFNDLLDKAAKLGLYNPNIPLLKNYCDMS
jgi:beta-lactamase regulating signal transducer with metallopeptidase domain